MLARGVAVGLLVGLTPTVGFQTLLMAGLCFLWRASFPAAFLVSWVSNPFTAPFLYFVFNRIGETVVSDFFGLAPSVPGFAAEASRQALFLAVGSALVALPAALLGYGLFLQGWRWSVLRQRKEGRKGPWRNRL